MYLSQGSLVNLSKIKIPIVFSEVAITVQTQVSSLSRLMLFRLALECIPYLLTVLYNEGNSIEKMQRRQNKILRISLAMTVQEQRNIHKILNMPSKILPIIIF